MAKLFSMNKPNCEDCGLGTVCRHPNLKFSGDGRLGILIVSTVPSSQESESGKYGSSSAYNFLDMQLEEMGYDLDKDFYYTTVVGCHTPRNRSPNTKETQYCSARLNSIINRLDPHTIILLGSPGFDAIVKNRASGRLTGLSANDCYGDNIPDQDVGRWLCPTWSVEELMEKKKYDDGGESKSYYLRDNAVFLTWKNHLRSAIANTEKPSIVDYKAMCQVTLEVDVALCWIREAMRWEYVAFDYETTGLKPHREGHKIVCASISNGSVSYSFPFFIDDPFFMRSWKTLMVSSTVGKIGHNNQFESSWTKVRGGDYWVKNWVWDTMLGMHCVHNKKPTSLKYCTYRELGIIGYDEAIDKYLKANKKQEAIHGCNAFNTVEKAPIQDLLQYNALDSLFSALLYPIQKRQLTSNQLEGVALLVETADTLVKMSNNGILVAEEQFSVVSDMLTKKLEEIHNDIMSSEEVLLWDGDDVFNFNSTKQLGHLVFDIMGIKPQGYTKKGNASLDKEAFKKLDHPFLKKIEKYREWEKMRGTYIEGWKKEIVDGKIHAFFGLNTVDTFRSSSFDVNLQNAYKRDKEKKKIVRSLVKAPPGTKIKEYDYKSLEVIINGCHSGDRNLIRYCTDASTDMHLDASTEVLELDPVTAKIHRGVVKGDYVFSEFYGNYHVPIAKDLWEYIHTVPELKQHIYAKGFTDLAKYTEHIRKCEDKLWNVRFKEHNKWRFGQYKEYLKKGYLNTLTGFRLQAPMSRNNTFNGAVQGDGFHCLCYTINKMQKKVEELGLKSYMIDEIHDSSVWVVYPEEEAIIDYWMWWYGTQQIRQDWTWITIPLQIEVESSDIGGLWCDMYTDGYLTGDNVV